MAPFPASARSRIDPATHVRLSANRNPDFAWSDVPAGTKSLALVCHDPDVPSRGDDVNQEGRVVPATLARVDFYHWVLVDIPGGHARSRAARIRMGSRHAASRSARSARGPSRHQRLHGVVHRRQGHGRRLLRLRYPCPPWNDEIPHRYVFTLYALDVPQLALDGRFTGADARRAMDGHVLAQASVTGRYTLNPKVAL